MKSIKNTVKLVCLFAVMLVSAEALAQGPGFDDDTVDEIPLDGGLSLLVAGGVGYGLKKIADNKKKAAQQNAK